jgi:rubrerythrin
MEKFENIKDAMRTAIQMEKDGYDFYQKAASQTSSDMGRSIFESLAKDELVHLDVFQKLFNETIGKSEWDELVNSSTKYKNLPIFPQDLKKVEGVNPDTNEIDALRMAMESESDAIDYYTEILMSSNDEEVNKILETVIDQEKKHYFLLEQEFNHLSSTGYWYDLDYLGG